MAKQMTEVMRVGMHDFDLVTCRICIGHQVWFKYLWQGSLRKVFSIRGMIMEFRTASSAVFVYLASCAPTITGCRKHILAPNRSSGKAGSVLHRSGFTEQNIVCHLFVTGDA